MLKIRLARHGSKNRPFYHVVVADARAPRDGRFVEKLGTYNPMLPKDAQRLSLDIDAVKKWMGNGAQPTDRVKRFLSEAGVVEKFVAPTNQTKQDKPKAKAVERAKEKEEKLAAAKEAEEEAKRQAEEEAKAAKAEAEKPAEEAAPAEETTEAPAE